MPELQHLFVELQVQIFDSQGVYRSKNTNNGDFQDLEKKASYVDVGKVFVNFNALIILSRLRKTVDAIKAKDRLYMSEMDMLDRVETYTKIHFSGKYNDVYTTPTKTQRTIFDLLGIKYEYKEELHQKLSACCSQPFPS